MELDSAVLPTAKRMHRGCIFIVKDTRKFTVNNSKNEVKHVWRGKFDLIFGVINGEFVCKFHKKTTALACVIALSASVQNVVTREHVVMTF